MNEKNQRDRNKIAGMEIKSRKGSNRGGPTIRSIGLNGKADKEGGPTRREGQGNKRNAVGIGRNQRRGEENERGLNRPEEDTMGVLINKKKQPKRNKDFCRQ